MNKRQRKKAVMRSISSLYDVVFEQGRFSKDMAIVCGMDPLFRRTLSTVMVKKSRYEWSLGELTEISLEGYVIDREIIKERTNA